MVPVPVISPPLWVIVSTVLSLSVLLITILPVSRSTTSLKFRIIFELTPIPVALSAGEEEDKSGLTVSEVVKLKAVVLEIPA